MYAYPSLVRILAKVQDRPISLMSFRVNQLSQLTRGTVTVQQQQTPLVRPLPPSFSPRTGGNLKRC